jgi:hypothetical protein
MILKELRKHASVISNLVNYFNSNSIKYNENSYMDGKLFNSLPISLQIGYILSWLYYEYGILVETNKISATNSIKFTVTLMIKPKNFGISQKIANTVEIYNDDIMEGYLSTILTICELIECPL